MRTILVWAFVLSSLHFVAGTRIKLRILQTPDFVRRTTRGAPLCSTLTAVDKQKLIVPVKNTKAPWEDSRVNVWNSSQVAQQFDFILGATVECLTPSSTFKQVFANLQEAGCWVLPFGGVVRDVVRGSAPNDVDMETSCSIDRAMSACEKHYGGQCWRYSSTSGIMHIGGSSSTSTFVDIANWETTMFGDGTSLEFSTNAMAYEWSQHTIIDMSQQTGPQDSCDSLIRIPVSQSQWNSWIDDPFDKTMRYWKLRAKGYSSANSGTANYMLDRLKIMTQKEDGRTALQYDYCKYALYGSFDKNKKICKTEVNCDMTNLFDKVLEDDFGVEYWSSILQPLFKEGISCTYSQSDDCRPVITPTKKPNSSTTTLPNAYLFCLVFVLALLVTF